jgi:hypothetical protein
MPGLQVNIDGKVGVIKTVSGGRTLVDFNHPLSGKELSYEFKINKIIEDDREKIKSIIRMSLNIKDIDADIKEGKADIKIDIKQELPEQIKKVIADKIKELVPSVKEVAIKKKEENKSDDKK